MKIVLTALLLVASMLLHSPLERAIGYTVILVAIVSIFEGRPMNRPDQLFAIEHMTRQEIADMLNSHFGRPEFSGDDSRLTDDVCSRFARAVRDVVAAGYSDQSIARVCGDAFPDLTATV